MARPAEGEEVEIPKAPELLTMILGVVEASSSLKMEGRDFRVTEEVELLKLLSTSSRVSERMLVTILTSPASPRRILSPTPSSER